MGLREESEQMYYATLTKEERARMHPCRKAKWYVRLPLISTCDKKSSACRVDAKLNYFSKQEKVLKCRLKTKSFANV